MSEKPPPSPYGYHWRTVVRPKILERAGGKFTMSYDDASDYAGLVAITPAMRRQREPKPTCRFYGMSHVVLDDTGKLLPSGGNECAAIVVGFAPCKMEVAGMPPDETCCPLAERYLKWEAGKKR